MGRIHQLSEDFINFLGSGEIIQETSSFLKETIENSIDASSTCVEVSLFILAKKITKISIKDNGAGIDPEDLPCLCKRYWTSKLENYDSLSTLNYLGFRGEALNAISYNAMMTVSSNSGRVKRDGDWSEGKISEWRAPSR
jgi:DNA mismatch repair ATPase MutL